MTAIVGVLNSQGIAIAADSAVTVSGSNLKKVYNRSNKIFTLSKFHPIGIAIYNRADFMGIPLETIIKMYRNKLRDSYFDTVGEYKNDFLLFLTSQIKHVSSQYKKSSFFSYCSWGHMAIINVTIDSLYERDDLDALELNEKKIIYSEVFTEKLEEVALLFESYSKTNYMTLSYDVYCEHYLDELTVIENYIEKEVSEEFEGFSISDVNRFRIKQLLYELINIELIFESHCGLAFFGFGEEEIYPSTEHVLVGTPLIDNPRIRHLEVIKINPGVLNSNIIPFAQADVTTTVLTGVDPNYKVETRKAVKTAFLNITEELGPLINNDLLLKQIEVSMTKISDQLLQGLDEYQWNKITGPLLEILENMGKEDMSELAESLVNITSLKRKFTSLDSNDESVGGPVDVAVISKADGFIWMKRKHYFDLEYNHSFKDKYLKF